MLTFFRRIRKSLLSSGAARKYLLYAIGEIALVVIGILIALQINNWNEEKKALENEKVLLLEVYDALATDSLAIKGHKRLLERASNFYETSFKVYKGIFPKDSLYDSRVMRRVSITKTVIDINYPNLAAEVIDQNVKLKVLNYYQAIARWRAYMDEYNRFIRGTMRPLLGEMQLQNYGAQFSKNNNLINNEKLFEELKNPKVQQIFFEAIQRTDGNWPYRRVIESLEELKTAIENVIQ